MPNWLKSLKQIFGGKECTLSLRKASRPPNRSCRPMLQTLEDRLAPAATPFGGYHGYDGTWDAATGALQVNVALADGALATSALAIATFADSGNTFVTLNGDPTAILASDVRSLTLSDADVAGLTYDLRAVRSDAFSRFIAPVSVTGFAATTLQVNNTPRSWNMDAMDSGSAAGTDYRIQFTAIGTIDAGTGADTFRFNQGSYVTGALDGGAGGGNTLDFVSYTTALSAQVAGSGAGSITLASSSFDFANIQNLRGSAGANRYDFGDGGSLSTLDGGGGTSNTLSFAFRHASIAADITGTGAGTVAEATMFRHIQTLNGSSAGGDTYTIEDKAGMGAIHGGTAGQNTLRYPASTTGGVVVNLHAAIATGVGSFSDIGVATVAATGSTYTLTGGDAANDWRISAARAGSVNGGSFAFSGFNVLNAGGGDTFTVDNGVTFVGAIHGGAGTDSLKVGSASQTVSLLTGSDRPSGFAGAVASVSGGFTGIDVLIGTGNNNTLAGENSACNWNLNVPINQYVTGGHTLTFTNFQTLNGGSGVNIFTLYGNFTGALDGGPGLNTFAFNGTSVLNGSIAGNSGNDTLSYFNYGRPLKVTLSADNADGFSGTENSASILGTFSKIDTLRGSPSSADSITGENAIATWALGPLISTYTHAGHTLTFSGIEKVISVPPTVTAANIGISGATGTGGAFKIGDIITVTWNNTATGDNNASTVLAAVSPVTVDFSQFGGPAAVVATNRAQMWSARYTIVAGSIDAFNRNVSVSVKNNAGNTKTTMDNANARVDNIPLAVTAANISIGGATGTAGIFTIGDTVTVTWNNTASGDHNPGAELAAINPVTVDFSQFGGPAGVVATNQGQMWSATYTIVAGSIDALHRNVSVSVEDDAGNTKTTTDNANASVNNTALIRWGSAWPS